MGLVDIERLKGIVGAENVKDNIADLYVYGSDSSVHEALPWVVVRPHTTEEVQNIMRYANPRMIPVVAKAAKGLISKGKVDDGLLNMVEMAFRSYDPCLACATHSLPGKMPLILNLRDNNRDIIKSIRRD